MKQHATILALGGKAVLCRGVVTKTTHVTAWHGKAWCGGMNQHADLLSTAHPAAATVDLSACPCPRPLPLPWSHRRPPPPPLPAAAFPAQLAALAQGAARCTCSRIHANNPVQIRVKRRGQVKIKIVHYVCSQAQCSATITAQTQPSQSLSIVKSLLDSTLNDFLFFSFSTI